MRKDGEYVSDAGFRLECTKCGAGYLIQRIKVENGKLGVVKMVGDEKEEYIGCKFCGGELVEL